MSDNTERNVDNVLVLSRSCAVCGRPVRCDQPQFPLMRDGSLVVHAACRCSPEPPPDGGSPGTPVVRIDIAA